MPAPGPVRESVRYGEQNLLARARELVGDRDPREHEFTVQLRACGAALLGKSLKGGSLLLIPISTRRQLNDLSDDMATKISILFYADVREALIKALGD